MPKIFPPSFLEILFQIPFHERVGNGLSPRMRRSSKVEESRRRVKEVCL